MDDEATVRNAFESSDTPDGTDASGESATVGSGADGADGRDTDAYSAGVDITAHTRRSDSRTTPVDRLRACLGPEESLNTVVDASVSSPAFDSDAIVGLTDRRLLAVSTSSGFVGVKRSAVRSVRSHVATVYALHSVDVRLVALVAFFTAVTGFAGLLGTTRDPMTPVLALVAVGGVFAVDNLRDGTTSGWSPVVDAARSAIESIPRSARWRRYCRSVLPHTRSLSPRDPPLVSLRFVVGLFALGLPVLGIAVLSQSIGAVVLLGLLLTGVSLLLYAHHNHRSLQGFDVSRQRRRIVHVSLTDGSLVTVRTDPECRLDLELSRTVGVGQ
jgi:hypothetical protein